MSEPREPEAPPFTPSPSIAVERFDGAMREAEAALSGGRAGASIDVDDERAEGPSPGEDGEAGEPPGAPPKLSDGEWALTRACAEEPANDVGNGRRLRLRRGRDLLRVERIGWHVWDGRRWIEDIEGKSLRPIAHGVAAAIQWEAFCLDPTPQEAEAMAAGVGVDEALLALEAQEDKSAADRVEIVRLRRVQKEAVLAERRVTQRRANRRKFSISSGNAGKLDGMIGEAAPYLSRAVGDMDCDPLALNVENGVVRLRAMEEEDPDSDPAEPRYRRVGRAGVFGHDRDHLMTKIAAAPWCPEARAPAFDGFLKRILPDANVRGFVQRYFGYSSTALTREQVFCLFHGEGANGKSTLVDVVSRVLGDYATSVPIATLVGEDRRKGSEATPDLVRLPGARLVRAAEPREGLGLDESLIKQLTSSEPILVRRLNQEFVEIYPTFKLVISANRKPKIGGDDDGIWRRVLLVPFDVQIPEAERDKDLAARLWAERAGVLAWLIEGARDYLAGGLRPPGEVIDATKDYRDESDHLGSFVRGALIVTRDSTDAIEAGTLYAIYERWCEREGVTAWRAATFNRRMAKQADRAGFVKAKASISIYQGVCVREGFEPRPRPPSRHNDD